MKKQMHMKSRKVHPVSEEDFKHARVIAAEEEAVNVPTINPARALSLWAHSDLLRDHIAFIFLNEKGEETSKKSNWEMWAKSGGIAKALTGWGIGPRDRVLLVYPPGLDFVAAFLACLRIGAIAVPAYPPDPRKIFHQASTLKSIAKDSGAKIALTDSTYIWIARYATTYANAASLTEKARGWINATFKQAGNSSPSEFKCEAWPGWLQWHSTSNLGEHCYYKDHESAGDDVAFLQYTSGSTSMPKGVMITYSALSHNLFLMIKAANHNTVSFRKVEKGDWNGLSYHVYVDDWIDDNPGTIVSWLPQYHDMGLIGNTLSPIMVPKGRQVVISPISFLKRPLLWAEAISRYQATVITAPDFGYSQLVKYASAAIREGESLLQRYDFSHIRLALNGAGMVRHKTQCDFIELFRGAGLPDYSYSGAFGLAEHCVYVCHGKSSTLFLDRDMLSKGKAVEVKEHEHKHSDDIHKSNILPLVSCGQMSGDVDVRVVCPKSLHQLEDGCVGEIWVHSPSKAGGYWGKSQETRLRFQAQIAGQSTKDYLRTGDLGFIYGRKLYFVSRLKDLIVVNGRNIVPDDVEIVISQSHKGLRNGCIAVFQPEEDVICAVAEIRTSNVGSQEMQEIINSITDAVRVRCNVGLHAVQLLKPRTIPKTTSGKVKRSECRNLYLSGNLECVHQTGKGQRSKLDTRAILDMPFKEADKHIQECLSDIIGDLGIKINGSKNLGAYGLDSSQMIELHSQVESVFGCNLPLTTLLDQPNLQQISTIITKKVYRNHGRKVETTDKEEKSHQTKDVASNGVPASKTFFAAQLRWESIAMLLYVLGIVLATANVTRTVDGHTLSLWRQMPRHFFKTEHNGHPDPPKILKYFGAHGLKDGWFGRKMDGFHERFCAWFEDLLPVHLIAGTCLLMARRMPLIQRVWSPAFVTILLSLCMAFRVHGLLVCWSLGTAAINYTVCERILPLARKRPILCRWVIWLLNLGTLAINNYFDMKYATLILSDSFLPGWPSWLVYGCRKHLGVFTPFMTYRYLVLRQLSYSLDKLEEARHSVADGQYSYKETSSGYEPARASPTPKQALMQYWAYILYGPLYFHGPCMQFRHFRKCGAAQTECPQAPFPSLKCTLLSKVAFPLSPGVFVHCLKELLGMLGFTLLMLAGLHTFYMPSVVFLIIHDSKFKVAPTNLLAQEYWVYMQTLLVFLFLQSHVVFGVSRAIALLDNVPAPHDTPMSYLRSCTSVRNHWNKFHISMRDFFLRYIFSYSNGSWTSVAMVVSFSTFMHGFHSLWCVWGIFNFVIICIERSLLKLHKRSIHGIQWTVLTALNQTFAFLVQLSILFPFSVISHKDEEDESVSFKLSLGGLTKFAIFNLAFSCFNHLRINSDRNERVRDGETARFFW